MPTKVMNPGGKSLGITVRKNYATRYKLKNQSELMITISKVK